MMKDLEQASASPIRIVLADDHDILRQGLSLLLDIQPDMHIVGEARTGPEAVTTALTLRPDVVVMDISMPEMDGLEACSQIRKQLPETQVLILTMHESEEYFLRALRTGAAGYLVKKAAPHELQSAVRTVAQGGVFLYPGLAKTLVRAYVTQPANAVMPMQTESSVAQELRVLTPREMEVLTLVAEGMTNQDIADHLNISIKTVQAHRANVMDKLGLHDITQLVRFALRHGLIAADV
jgi:DNA-binding NarL/FixJ family response regulator